MSYHIAKAMIRHLKEKCHWTYEDIGKLAGVSRQRIEQILHDRDLQRRRHSRREMWDPEDNTPLPTINIVIHSNTFPFHPFRSVGRPSACPAQKAVASVLYLREDRNRTPLYKIDTIANMVGLSSSATRQIIHRSRLGPRRRWGIR